MRSKENYISQLKDQIANEEYYMNHVHDDNPKAIEGHKKSIEVLKDKLKWIKSVEIKEIARITHGEDEWYLKKIDGTHVKTANNREALENGRGAVWHIAQFRGKPYYEDVREWLYGRKPIDGNQY